MAVCGRDYAMRLISPRGTRRDVSSRRWPVSLHSRRVRKAASLSVGMDGILGCANGIRRCARMCHGPVLQSGFSNFAIRPDDNGRLDYRRTVGRESPEHSRRRDRAGSGDRIESRIAALIVLPFIFRHTDTANLQPLWNMPNSLGSTGNFLKALGIAMVAVLWPYDGWINLGPVAEDIKDPRRNVPRAMAIGLGTVIVVYLGANLSYHLVLPIDHLANSGTVAADMFEQMFGHRGAQIAAIGVMISTFGATNSNMITGPRIYLAIARDGLVPRWLQIIHPVYRTPANTILLQAAWAIFLVLLFSIWDPSATPASPAPSHPVSPLPTVSSTTTVSDVAKTSVPSAGEAHSRRLKNAFDKYLIKDLTWILHPENQ